LAIALSSLTLTTLSYQPTAISDQLQLTAARLADG
jgi:hypothetical protein